MHFYKIIREIILKDSENNAELFITSANLIRSDTSGLASNTSIRISVTIISADSLEDHSAGKSLLFVSSTSMGFRKGSKSDSSKGLKFQVIHNGAKPSSDARSTEDKSNEESKEDYGHDFLQRKKLFIEIN